MRGLLKQANVTTFKRPTLVFSHQLYALHQAVKSFVPRFKKKKKKQKRRGQGDKRPGYTVCLPANQVSFQDLNL